MEQFLRTEHLIGKDKLERLRRSLVTVVGVGAVGSYVVEALARAGVGNFRLVDCDVISKSNMNRNLLASAATLGKTKVACACDRIQSINPQAVVSSLPLFAAADTMESIFAVIPDLAIDAIDSVNPKVQLISYVYHQHIPLISSMGAAVRTDPSAIKCADLFDAEGCPLARQIRKRLRRCNIQNGVKCVYSDEPIEKGYSTDTAGGEEYYARGRRRRLLGSLPTIPGIFGLFIAQYAIDFLCGGIRRDTH